MQDELLSIGRLSKIAKVSVDTIRYYDDVGLLKPAYVSNESGYRYYAAEQAETLMRIRELKTFGFPLSEKTILLGDETSLVELYQNRYWSLLRDKAKLQQAIDKMSEKIKFQQEVWSMEKRISLLSRFKAIIFWRQYAIRLTKHSPSIK